jgi:adenine-specific DNA-methyltransferase
MRPEVGTQAQFRKKKDPATYRYDSSLSPALDWDGGNGARELGEWLLACIEDAAKLPPPHAFAAPRVFTSPDPALRVEVASLHDAVDRLKRLGRPFLDWAGKAERLSFDVPTLPLFVHERLSTRAIVDTKGGYDDSVWDHLAGTVSAPFEAGEHRQIAVKVIDDRGNELLVVEMLPGPLTIKKQHSR